MASETNSDHERRHDQRGAHRAADRLADSGGPARGGEAVVGVHQHDHHRHRDRLNEGPDRSVGFRNVLK